VLGSGSGINESGSETLYNGRNKTRELEDILFKRAARNLQRRELEDILSRNRPDCHYTCLGIQVQILIYKIFWVVLLISKILSGCIMVDILEFCLRCHAEPIVNLYCVNFGMYLASSFAT
jgi:hypothetical protein